MSLITLIPAFKVNYFEETLHSLSRQSVLPDKIIISDDSKNGAVIEYADRLLKTKMANLQDKVILIEGPKEGAHTNIVSLIDGFIENLEDRFHVLFDDDILSDKFYEMHNIAFNKYQCGLTINKRHFIDVNNKIIPINQYPGLIDMINSDYLIMHSLFLNKSTVPLATNWLGEYSNCVISAKYKDIVKMASFSEGYSYYGLEDIGNFLKIAETEPIAFINQYLSGFRQSPHQNTTNLSSKTLHAGVWAWAIIAIHAHNNSFITDIEFLQAIRSVNDRQKVMLKDYYYVELDCALSGLTQGGHNSKDIFTSAWNKFLSSFDEGLVAIKVSRGLSPKKY
jgi:hypothetical protein